MIDRVIFNENIALCKADGIVNASNGCGYMGGRRCIKEQHRGVAESLQYVSKGEIEKLAKKKVRDYRFWICPKGNVFVTEAPNLNATYIIHAVTMNTPGSKAKMETVKELIPKIIEVSESYNLETVAVPLLGTGTGGLSRKFVYDYLIESFKDSHIKFWIYANGLDIHDI